jgi:hypothetical protein
LEQYELFHNVGIDEDELTLAVDDARGVTGTRVAETAQPAPSRSDGIPHPVKRP